MMVLTTLALLLVIGTRPNRLRNRVSCPFVKTLPQKLGIRPAKVHPFLLSTALRHGRNPAVLLHLFSTGITIALRTQCGQQALRQGCPQLPAAITGMGRWRFEALEPGYWPGLSFPLVSG